MRGQQLDKKWTTKALTAQVKKHLKHPSTKVTDAIHAVQETFEDDPELEGWNFKDLVFEAFLNDIDGVIEARLEVAAKKAMHTMNKRQIEMPLEGGETGLRELCAPENFIKDGELVETKTAPFFDTVEFWHRSYTNGVRELEAMEMAIEAKRSKVNWVEKQYKTHADMARELEDRGLDPKTIPYDEALAIFEAPPQALDLSG